ncbi:MAG: PleD family two-component system response regulator [Pseudomonadota bacterium]
MSARILVVDDILANRRLLQAKLEARYFQVILASSGVEAIEIAKEAQPDIILMDVMMPGMDGYEATRRLKSSSETTHIPVVMVTALSQQEHRLQGLEAGADDFIIKPFDDFGLLSRINALTRYNAVARELRQREAGAGFSFAGIDMDSLDMSVPPRIVIVEENAGQASRLAGYLNQAGHKAVTMHEAGAPDAEGTDVMVLSLTKQSFDPLRLCAQFKISERTRAIAIIVVCDRDTEEMALQALELGASDIIQSPVDPQELVARVMTQTRRTRYIEVLRRRVDRGMELAIIDPLTGLYNRRYMMSQMLQLMQRTAHGDMPTSVMALDIDHFKSVNDTMGHDAGDRVLIEFSERLKKSVRPKDTVCRQGGEEFIVIMPDTPAELACRVAERVRENVAADPFVFGNDGAEVRVTVSAGVATDETGRNSAEDLLRRADDALYQAKEAGRNRVKSLAA